MATQKPKAVNTSVDPGLSYLDNPNLDVIAEGALYSGPNGPTADQGTITNQLQRVTSVVYINNNMQAGGANNEVQLNLDGIITGDNELRYDANTNVLTTGGLTLTGNLLVNGTSNLGGPSGLKITGGSTGQFLKTDGNGNIAWASVSDFQATANWTANSGPSRILNKPTFATVATSGSYNDLQGIPSLVAVATDGQYSSLSGRPTIPGNTSQLINDSGFVTSTGIPTQTGNSGKYLTTNGNITSWATVSIGVASYNDLTNKPTIPAAQIQSDWTQTTNTELDFIKNKPTLVTNLDSLSDVTITSASSGQVLKYNGNVWINDTDSTGGGASTGNITFSDTTMASTNGNVKIGFSPSASPAVEFTFVTTGNLALPKGTILSETANSTTITPPNALAGQGLVVRLTGAQGIASDHPGGFTDGDTITVYVTPDYNVTPVTGTVDYTFTGCTSVELGRALTGTLTFTSEPSKEITWTIPVSSTITTFTITLSNASGFDISLISPLTLTSTGSSEDHHIHLIAGDPSITDIYLGDDDQYVKIEKNGGNVLIGTDTNSKRWIFDTNGDLTVPGTVTSDDRLTLNSGGANSGYVAAVLADGDLGKVLLRTDNGTSTKTWEFNKEGNLMLPNGGDIVDSTGNSVLGGGGGIALTDLSIGTDGTPTGGGNVSYNNTTGVFTYTPPVIPDISGFVTGTPWTSEGYLTSSDLSGYALSSSVPAAQIQSDWTQTDNTLKDYIKNKPALFDGAYSSLSGTPTIPTKTSDLSNDSGFITSSTPALDNASAGDMDVMIYDGNLKHTSSVTIDASTGHLKTAGDLSVPGNVTIQGNLNVVGTTVTTNQTTLSISDSLITLNSGTTGTPTLNASLVVDRGSSADTSIRWNEITDKWQQTRDGSTYVDIPVSTTELTEGTNQYFTNARARTAISVTGSGSYDNTTGVITVTGGVTSVNTLTGAVTLSTTNISEGTNLYYTDARANTAFDNRLATKSTSNVTEGTNLYYTNARANSAMAAFTGNLTAGNASVTANISGGNLSISGISTVTGTITGGNLTSNAEIAGYGALTLGNIANATATKTRIVTAGTISYIQTGNGTAGSTGNVVFSPTLDSTARVSIDTSSGNLNATGNITGANLIAGSSGTGNVYAGNVIATSVIVNGQTVELTGAVNPDYINMTTSAAVNVAASGTDLTWDVNNGSSGIAYSAGKFSLTAGKTYHVLAEIAMQNFSANGYLLVELVNGTTNARIGSQTLSIPYNTGFNEANNPTLDIVHTPVANQDVKLRVTGGSSGLTAQLRGSGFTRMSIVQINPTASLSAVSTINASGNVSVGGNLTTTGGIRKSARVLTTTTTLTVADAGGFIEFSPGGTYTITLPNPTLAASSGIGYRFWQNTTDNITLSTPAGAFYGPSGSSTSTKVLAQATTQYWDVWCDGFNWAVFGIKIA